MRSSYLKERHLLFRGGEHTSSQIFTFNHWNKMLNLILPEALVFVCGEFQNHLLLVLCLFHFWIYVIEIKTQT